MNRGPDGKKMRKTVELSKDISENFKKIYFLHNKLKE